MSIEFKGEKKKPYRVGTVQTVDIQTGKVVEERRNAMTLLPPGEGKCAECAVAHPSGQPHNPQSLYYQISFHAKHGRWPDWRDALAHCATGVQAAWEAELRERGVWDDGPEGGGGR